MWIFKPLLTLILYIHILDSKYEAYIYIWLLVNIEMKLYSKSILSSKLPLPSACFLLSRWTDQEGWYFELLSADMCRGAKLIRALSPRQRAFPEYWHSAGIMTVPLPPVASPRDTFSASPLPSCSLYLGPQGPSCPSQVGIFGCWVLCPPRTALISILLSRMESGLWCIGLPSPGPIPQWV